jgi:sugar lactone lactonase YvrE
MKILSFVASLLLTSSGAIWAQGTISTAAGTGLSGFGGDTGPAVSALLAGPAGVAFDAAGNVFIADTNNFRIRRITPAGVITTYAGNGISGYSGDGVSAVNAQLRSPRRVVAAADGTLFIADSEDHRVRRVSPGGIISTYAGNGQQGYSGDGGTAITARLDGPSDVALDAAGNLYIAELGNLRVRRVTPGGIITTYAGNGNFFSTGDGGQATAAGLAGPTSLAIDAAGNLYIGEFQGKVRRVTPAGIISTVAGSNNLGYAGDGGAATSARLGNVQGIAIDPSGNLLIADTTNHRIRKVTPGGLISTEAGNGTPGSSGDGTNATFAQLNAPADVAVDPSGAFVIAESLGHRVRRVGPIAPSTTSTAPFVSTGMSQIFTFTFTHQESVAQIGVVNALINTALVGNNACYIAYSHPQGVLYLVNDGGTESGLSSPLVLGGAGSVSNSQCTILGGGSAATVSGNSLTLTLNVTFTPNFMGNKVVYLAGRSVTEASSGWRTAGVSIIPESLVAFPRSGDANPATGESNTALISFTYQDVASTDSIQTVWALTNTAVDGARACYVAYFKPGNALVLVPDNGDGNAAQVIPLSGVNSIENSQCRISTEGSSATTVGNTLTLTLNLFFKSGFGPSVGMWTAANTVTGLTSPWKIVGVRRVP